MNSRQRLQMALRHEEPDRVPVDLGATSVTGIHAAALARLRRAVTGDAGHRVRVTEPYQMLGEVDGVLRDALGIDVVGLAPRTTLFGFENADWKPFTLFDGTEVLVPGNFRVRPNDAGDLLIYPEGDLGAPPSGVMPRGGHFFDTIVRQMPIDEERLDPSDNLEEFAPFSEENLAWYARVIHQLQAKRRREGAEKGTQASGGHAGEGGGGRAEARTTYPGPAARGAKEDGPAEAGTTNSVDNEPGVILTMPGAAFGDIALVPAPWLKHPHGIRDITEWYMSTVTRRDYVRRVFDKQCEIALANLERLIPVLGDRVDAVFLSGTDFGTQRSSFISPDDYRDLYQPYHRAINDLVHARTGWKTFIHSCGAVHNLIPHFIESGFDILNPVQCSATGMDARDLKREFGRDLVFWGGGVDTQKTLPFGTPEEVYREVRERIEIFGAGGGFVFDTVHNVQANTPVENMQAMFRAVRDAARG